jgi:small subunit ribosomal protein S21
LEIRVDDKNIEKAIRLLKRKMQTDGLFRELKNRRHYEKPSIKKKRKRIEAKKRRLKSLRMSKTNTSSTR